MSIIGHPFLISLLVVWALESRRGSVTASRTVAVVAALFVFPLALVTWRQVRKGAWSTVDASHLQERPLLFLIGAIGLGAMLVYFALDHTRTELMKGTAVVLVMIGVCAAVTPWLKVSLHMATAGVAASLFLARGMPLGWLLVPMLPLLGWSRVALGRHRWSDVVAGLILGAGTGAIITFIR